MATKPIYDPSQIENELYINWGGGLQGISRSWDTHNLTVYLGTIDGPVIPGTQGEGAGGVPMTDKEATFAKAAFNAWSEVADLTFTYVDSYHTANISMGYSTTTKNDGTYDTDVAIDQDHLGKLGQQDIFLSADASAWPDQQDANISYTNYGFITMMHEIGHSLGLSHPGEYDAGDSKNAITYDNDAIFAQDNRQNTIMSYFGYEYFYSSGGKYFSGWTTDGTVSSVDVYNDPKTAGELIIYPSTPMVYDILPICFKAGSLGEGLPKRDLWISPHHAMYLDGVLIEAKDLVNGVSIVQAEKVERVDYFHIELDSHDVILAEGAWSETFVDDDSRAMFHNVQEYDRLYPRESKRAARYCAPRIEAGYELEDARRRIAERAGLAVAGAEAGDLRGYVDRVDNEAIEGWAQCVTYPEAPVCLDILLGDEIVGRTLANRYREDLHAAGLGSGRHGFRFALPFGLGFLPGSLRVQRSLDGAALQFSGRSRTIAPSREARRRHVAG